MKVKLILFLLICNSTIITASQTDTLLIFSKSMNKYVPNTVILPDNYSVQRKPFPVLYLLHGAYGNYTDWLNKVPALKKYADTYDIIIVCPDGSNNSWYFDSPVDTSMKYETYISKELTEAVDKRYNTSAEKTGRAIAGLSMGGHGAFYLAFKHQDVWGAAGSMSGCMNLIPFADKWNIADRLGNYTENKERWEKNSVINMVYLLKNSDLKLIFDCGTDDFFYDVNKQMHEKLLVNNIPHDYIERSGTHSWNYWSNSLKYQLVFFDTFFKSFLLRNE